MKELASRIKALEKQLAICTRCGTCQSVCPIFEQTRKESDVARGKLALLDGLHLNIFTNPNGVYERLNKCLLCGSCAANCPSGVNAVEIFIKARGIITEYKGLSLAKKLIFKKVVANPEVFDQFSQWLKKFQFIFTKKDNNIQETSCYRLVSPLLNNRHFPSMLKKSFHESTSFINTSPGKSGLKVMFFTGCIIDKAFPKIANDLVYILKHHGVGLYIPKNLGCCGIPALAFGDMKTFEKLIEYHIKLFYKEKFDYLVTACATCTFTIKKLWPSFYNGKATGIKQSIKEISEKTLDINQFLVKYVEIINKEESTPDYSETETVTFHDPCHLKKSLGVIDEPRKLIKASGNKLVEMDGADKCCGMGGSFNIYHYGISSKIGNLKQKNIADTNCSTVATGCPACMIQISDMLAKNKLNIRVRHPLELYAESIKVGAKR